MSRPKHILPSYLKQRASGSRGTKSKKPNTVTTWDRDITCLPKESKKGVTTWDRDIICLPKESKKGENCIPYPHEKYRARLGREGLVGKVHLTSEMSMDKVVEIRSV